jgi:hypothetical protein
MPSLTRKAVALHILRDHRFKFRSLAVLGRATGLEGDALRKLLTEISARPERNNAELWGLISRVGEAQVEDEVAQEDDIDLLLPDADDVTFGEEITED